MANKTSDPVGVLDSSLGGLSIFKALREELPNEDLLYCADCANAPWGDRTEDYIVARTHTIARFLLAHGAKAIVLACNTATAVAADSLRQTCPVPVIGIEPAIKPAALSTQAGVIGMIATTRTTKSERYKSLLQRFQGSSKVISVATPGLMECVERGEMQASATRALLEKYLAPIKEAGADKLVLGCTHYPFLSPLIAEIMGPGVELIESGRPVALVTRSRLAERNLLRPAHQGREAFFIAGAKQHSKTLLTLFAQARSINELTI